MNPVPVMELVELIRGIATDETVFKTIQAFAITLGKTGDLTGTDAIAWSLSKNTPYVPSPLLYGDLLYFFAGNNGQLSIANAADGKLTLDAARNSTDCKSIITI